MKYLLLIFTCYILSSFTASAAVHTSPELEEADNMVEIAPSQSLNIAKAYLVKRKLLDSTSQNQIIAREGAKDTSRTPASSVHAMQIMAKSYSELNLPALALDSINAAQNLSKEKQLIYLDLENQLIRIEILLHQNTDSAQLIHDLDEIEEQLDAAEPKNAVLYSLAVSAYELKAQIYIKNQDDKQAGAYLSKASQTSEHIENTKQKINFHLLYGRYFLNTSDYDNALTQLLISYWMAVESSESALLARSNYYLGRLFFERQVFDKSLSHSAEAADFYKKYPDSKQLAQAVSLMADSYYNQGKYNLALVHYLNILGNRQQDRTQKQDINLWLNIAKSYLSLSNKEHAQLYIHRAKIALKETRDSQLQAKAYLLTAGMAMLDKNYDQVIEQSNKAIVTVSQESHENIRLSSYQLLSQAYELKQQPVQALSALKAYQDIFYKKLAQFNAVNEDIFKQQKDIIEQSLHYNNLEKRVNESSEEVAKYQRLAIFGFVLTCLMLILLIRRIYTNQYTRKELRKQTQQLYTHPRTGLQNLRMLNAKLPHSLQHSSAVLEQWRLGELIDEPLTDRLHFVLFDLPMLPQYYLAHGYREGLALEKSLGQHLKKQVIAPARLYHFSESLFLYITPQQNPKQTAEGFFKEVSQWLQPFPQINAALHMGIADYPFLSKAFTAINAQELIDILFSAISAAGKVSKEEDEPSDQWVHIYTIDNAPAASFASHNIRQTCLKALQQGLIKLNSSAKDEEKLRKLYIESLAVSQSKLPGEDSHPL